jgi:hypothetical protein
MLPWGGTDKQGFGRQTALGTASTTLNGPAVGITRIIQNPALASSASSLSSLRRSRHTETPSLGAQRPILVEAIRGKSPKLRIAVTGTGRTPYCVTRTNVHPYLPKKRHSAGRVMRGFSRSKALGDSRWSRGVAKRREAPRGW